MIAAGAKKSPPKIRVAFALCAPPSCETENPPDNANPARPGRAG